MVIRIGLRVMGGPAGMESAEAAGDLRGRCGAAGRPLRLALAGAGSAGAVYIGVWSGVCGGVEVGSSGLGLRGVLDWRAGLG